VANERHDIRVHLIASLPSLIHCSHVPCLNEANARIELAGVPFDLGDDTARIRLASSPLEHDPRKWKPVSRKVHAKSTTLEHDAIQSHRITRSEACMGSPYLVWRTTDRAVEQVADPVLSCDVRFAGSRMAYLILSASRNS